MFVEPDPRYGAVYSIDDDEEPEDEALLLEDGEGVLLAHELMPVPLEGSLYFVDGVRRTDFRVHDLLPTGAVVRGLAGSFGVGAVCCRSRRRPEFLGVDVERRLLWTHGHAAALPPVGGWQWSTEALASTDADQLLPALQRRMRDAEADLAGRLATDGSIVVRDGPLNRLYGIRTQVVGLVKSHHKTYLPAEKHREVPSVLTRPGMRTSLFRLRDEAWGCFLRLPTSGRVSPWAGIVRIDVPASGGLGTARAVADRVCAAIPRYAGVPYADPRAPANLQPIGALEGRLRHLLGDPAGALRAGRDAAAIFDVRPEGAVELSAQEVRP
jgi:hypothetical protein